jgi:hypothetical protein
MAMMDAEMKSMSDAGAPLLAIQQEENRELKKDVPDLGNPTALSANAQEKQRFLEIENKYKPLIAKAQQPGDKYDSGCSVTSIT